MKHQGLAKKTHTATVAQRGIHLREHHHVGINIWLNPTYRKTGPIYSTCAWKKKPRPIPQQSLSRELHCMMMHDDACCFRACDIFSTQYFWHPYPDPTYYEPNIPQLDLGFSGLWFPAPARLTVMVWSLSLPLKDMYLGPDLKVGACKYLQNPPLDSTWQSMILVVDTWSRVKLSCRVLPCAQSNPWRNRGVFDVGLYSWYPL